MLEKTDKKIGIFNQRVKKVYMTHQLRTKNYLWRKTLLIFTFSWSAECRKKAHNGSRLATNCLNVICVRDREKWIMWHRSTTKRISLDYYFDNFIALEGRQPYFVCAKREVVVSILSLRYLVRIDFLCDFPTPVMWLYLWYRSLHFDTTREFSLGFYGPNLGD